MRLVAFALIVLCSAPLSAVLAAADAAPDWSRWVHKLEVLRQDGGTDLGSAVSIAPGRVLTNCHVVRNASRIVLIREQRRWTARLEIGDAYRDLCFLEVAGLPDDLPGISGPDTYRVGGEVTAVGYSSGRYAHAKGRIKGLYACACDGGQVIQTSAPFDPGASGGGLFDADGRLLGILTFKSVAGGDFHFAVPVSWMARLNQTPLSTSVGDKRPFWERETEGGGHFLAACDLQAKRNWPALADLARDWTRQQPADPQAWVALGRAEQGLSRRGAARVAFQRALELDSTHAEAVWALQELEFEENEKP